MSTAKAQAAPGTLLVADTGPLIVLGLAGLLEPTADVYGPLAVPEAVLAECLAQPGLPGEAAVRAALKSRHLRKVPAATPRSDDPLMLQGLGLGELAVLAYAQEHRLTALVDERKARRTARRLGLAIIGSGAVLVGLKRGGRLATIGTVLDQWAAHGYFVGNDVRMALLAAAGE